MLQLETDLLELDRESGLVLSPVRSQKMHPKDDVTTCAGVPLPTRQPLIDPLRYLPDDHLVARYGAAKCLQDRLMPWRQVGDETVVLTANTRYFADHQTDLHSLFGPIRYAAITGKQLDHYISTHHSAELVSQAETRVPANESCRNWNSRFTIPLVLLALGAFVVFGILAPRIVFATLTAWAMLILALNTGLKAMAAYVGRHDAPEIIHPVPTAELPVITVLVPLYMENAIADHLLTRLHALDYPRELLDVCLVLEADDLTTRATLGKTALPKWMRAIVVPEGTIKTKPRALNYALDFARGSIIGVWDAEDAPDPDQLHSVARHFANAGPRVACVQGTLDYYNASKNWLTRCFTIEYAVWFRVVLPGFQRMGLVVPLGGTTLFFRREILKDLGGWDAHNVTEDADLGVRLARHGYETILIPTVTEEEANGRAWPWVKQRSRWLKGYAMTYAVHMRDPVRLWRELGTWRFFGLQLLFLGTLSQFVLAPVLWTFWLLPFGFEHPLSAWIPPAAFWGFAGLFIITEAVNFIVAVLGVRKAGKSWLIKWAITLQFYFPLAAIAAYKGLFEMLNKPFYWDKTAHGVLLPDACSGPTIQPPQQPLHPASNG